LVKKPTPTPTHELAVKEVRAAVGMEIDDELLLVPTLGRAVLVCTAVLRPHKALGPTAASFISTLFRAFFSSVLVANDRALFTRI
jgi:hypothetical protein